MPVVSFCCHFYGWKLEDCLKLPLKSIFAFHREGKKIQAENHLELLKIQAVSIMKYEYFEWRRDQYLAIIDPKIKELPTLPEAPKNNEELELSPEETRNKIIRMFSKGKRGMGYGR